MSRSRLLIFKVGLNQMPQQGQGTVKLILRRQIPQTARTMVQGLSTRMTLSTSIITRNYACPRMKFP